MWVYDHMKKKIFLTRNKKRNIVLNEDYLLQQFKEEVSEELSVDKKDFKKNKEEEK